MNSREDVKCSVCGSTHYEAIPLSGNACSRCGRVPQEGVPLSHARDRPNDVSKRPRGG
jgi:transposase